MADETVIPFTPPAPPAPVAGVDPVPVADPVPAEATAPIEQPAPAPVDPAPVVTLSPEDQKVVDLLAVPPVTSDLKKFETPSAPVMLGNNPPMVTTDEVQAPVVADPGPQPHDAYYAAASAQPDAVDEETMRLQPPQPPIASDASSMSFGEALKALSSGHTIGRASIRLSPSDTELDDWRVF